MVMQLEVQVMVIIVHICDRLWDKVQSPTGNGIYYYYYYYYYFNLLVYL